MICSSRQGFQRLVSDVGMGRAGIVMGQLRGRGSAYCRFALSTFSMTCRIEDWRM
jgi:hypothetical protein